MFRKYHFSGCQRRSFHGRHLRAKKNFLGVVVYTLNKRWRRRKEEKLRNRILFSANTWVPGAKVLQSFEICCEDFEMYCEDFRICSEFKMCFKEVGICCA